MILLPLINKPSLLEISMISGSYYIRRVGSHLDDTTTDPSVIFSNQATTTVARRGKGGQNVSLGGL